MNRKSKYIVVNYEGIELPIVFSDLMTHAAIARQHTVVGAGFCYIVGAGFCYIEANEYVCYGESISLDVKSRGGEDSAVLNEMLGTIRAE